MYKMLSKKMKQSRRLNEVHESVTKFHKLGIVDKQTMLEFDQLCIENIEEVALCHKNTPDITPNDVTKSSKS